jgi:excisionase family DNA binding protein
VFAESSPGELLIEAIAEAVALKIRKLLPDAKASEPLAYPMRETATLMNVSLSTLKTMVRAREIAVVRRGTKVLITRRAIEEWLERNEV